MEIPDATEKIKKGEQVRLLFELLMEKLGGNFEESRGQFFDRLKTCFEEHEEAINVFKEQIKQKDEQKTQEMRDHFLAQPKVKMKATKPNKNEGVSLSNY